MPEKITLEVGEPLDITSMCPRCQREGNTRLLMLSVPHFKEILISSFECGADPSECGATNREVAFIGSYAREAVEMELHVAGRADLNMQVVLSSHSSIRIPELDFEIPPREMKQSLLQNEQLAVEAHGMGGLTTVEGILSQVHTDISANIESLAASPEDSEYASALRGFLGRLEELMRGERPFTFVLSDISGNAYISALEIGTQQTPEEALRSGKLAVRKRERTHAEDVRLGIVAPE